MLLQIGIPTLMFNLPPSFLMPKNFPLYLRTVDPQNETDLQFQYLVHTCIDVVEEKGQWYIILVMSVISFLDPSQRRRVWE